MQRCSSRSGEGLATTPGDMTIGRLAKATGLSRSTLLYYDRLGLLRPTNRSSGNYRLYSAEDAARLRRICRYRQMGVGLDQIARLLDSGDESHSAEVLQRHLDGLETQIVALRAQQQQVVKLLEQLASRRPALSQTKAKTSRQRSRLETKRGIRNEEKEMVDKQRWVEIMKAAGLTEADMWNWHRQFEKLEPDAHQEFLESLGIDAAEIGQIREKSRA